MRRNLLTLAIAAGFGLFLTAGQAQANHDTVYPSGQYASAQGTVITSAPVYESAGCAPAPKKCHFSLPKLPKINCHFSLPKLPKPKCNFTMPKLPKFSLCHKSAPVCDTTPACGSCGSAPVSYESPIIASPQSYPSAQGIAAPQTYSAPQVLSSGQ